jgi:hypothetical protein
MDKSAAARRATLEIVEVIYELSDQLAQIQGRKRADWDTADLDDPMSDVFREIRFALWNDDLRVMSRRDPLIERRRAKDREFDHICRIADLYLSTFKRLTILLEAGRTDLLAALEGINGFPFPFAETDGSSTAERVVFFAEAVAADKGLGQDPPVATSPVGRHLCKLPNRSQVELHICREFPEPIPDPPVQPTGDEWSPEVKPVNVRAALKLTDTTFRRLRKRHPEWFEPGINSKWIKLHWPSIEQYLQEEKPKLDASQIKTTLWDKQRRS